MNSLSPKYANLGIALLSAILTGTLLIGSILRSPRQQAPNPTATITPAEQGQIYYQANCASCHGNLEGETLGNIIGKNLIQNPFIQDSSDAEMVIFIQTGRAANDPMNTTGIPMPPFGGILSDDQLLAIIAYLRTFNEAEAVETEETVNITPPPDYVVGEGNSTGYQWVKVADNFDNPLFVTSASDGSGRLFVVEQTGFILILQDSYLLPNPFLNISTLVPDEVYSGGYSEQGLLGLAFHPDFATNGFVFTSSINREGDSVITRYQVSNDNPNQLDPTSAEIVLTVDQPYPDHNGGNMAFGPDGYLYIGFGDGGKPAEPNYFSQEPNLFLGKLIRLDVDSLPYQIPPNNPFIDQPEFLPEIWALGLRNPWRFSFDRQTGDLYLGDVGQWLWEEINFQPADGTGGQNYGWSAYEADQIYLEDETLSGGELTLPVLTYSHDEGCSITGGYVYRGEALPALQGQYFYGDYCNGTIWTASQDEDGTWQGTLFMDTDLVISSFGQDEAGELYLVNYKGAIYRLEAN